MFLHISAAKIEARLKETESFAERKRHRVWESSEKIRSPKWLSNFKKITVRAPEGDTVQSNSDGTSCSLKSPWRAGGCHPLLCAVQDRVRCPGLAGLAVAALRLLHLLGCRAAVHIQLLGALNLVTPLAPLTPPQIRFAPDFPSLNSLLFRGANLLGIFRGKLSDSGPVFSNFRACQASS